MRRVCTVLARAGSIGLPGKNLRSIGGTSLVARSIRDARETGLFSTIVVSTNDPAVREIALSERVDLVVERPQELATSRAPKLPAIRHAVDQAEAAFGRSFDVVVDIQPTSPLRTPDDICGAVQLLESQPKSVNVVTGCRSHKSPYFDMVQDMPGEFVQLVCRSDGAPHRRQDAPVTYDLNGAVYAWWREHLEGVDSAVSRRTRLFVMPPERSIDIDTELDFLIAELLCERINEFGRGTNSGEEL
jgi:CMP-N-acetylneuraminic acid synthetase